MKLRLSPNIKCKVYKVLKIPIKSVRVKKVGALIGDEEVLIMKCSGRDLNPSRRSESPK